MQDNVTDRIIKELPKPVVGLIQTAGRAAAKSGAAIYMVGGIVRDLLLGRQSKDIDIMVEGDALDIARSMSVILANKPIVHKRFGTATFKLNDYRVDLATCRSEIYDAPGSLPKVKPGTIEQDLFRRDFTVNAMAIRISQKRFGELIDLYGGRQDLENKLIRILHEKSFIDDATRIMRSVRYEQRLDFKLESKTARLLRRDLDMLDTISGDRLRHEVILWLSETQPAKILKRAARLGVLSKLHPALSWDPRLAKAFRDANRMSIDFPPVQLYLALLVYNLDKRQLGEFLERLNIKGGELDEVARQTVSLKIDQESLDYSPLQPSEIYQKLQCYKTAAIQANCLCTPSRDVRINLKLYLDKLRFVRTRLNGRELKAMGVLPGKKMGIILDRLLTARLDGEVKTKADEQRLALQLLRDL
ncbi:MAG: CCA tRNA nucleotidyltransferase [Chloroflexi bacterium]|nr:CCA tRNA nucleotidyltransferase [Chloroflexota bacterium]